MDDGLGPVACFYQTESEVRTLKTVGRTPWTGDEPIARPLPTHHITNIEETQTDILASNGIRIHDQSIRAGEDISYFRPRSHCDRLKYPFDFINSVTYFKKSMKIFSLKNRILLAAAEPSFSGCMAAIR
jgi:hypothetical protein